MKTKVWIVFILATLGFEVRAQSGATITAGGQINAGSLVASNTTVNTVVGVNSQKKVISTDLTITEANLLHSNPPYKPGGTDVAVTDGGTGKSTAAEAIDNLTSASEASVASASTVDLGAQTSQQVLITGSNPITSFGTIGAGIKRWIRFSGTPTITHNSTSMILPSGAPIVVTAGDSALAISLGGGNWRVTGYTRADGTALVGGGSGSGDVSSNTSSSVDGEIALMSGTGGKTIRRATQTGIAKLTAGVLGTATSGTDYAPATSGSAILKGNGSGGTTAAVSGTDYAPATSGSALLKGNGSGGTTAAVSGTDYAPATSGSALLKGNGSGGTTAAVSGTDYAPATSGSSVLKGNGSGGTSAASTTTDIYAPGGGAKVAISDGGTGQATANAALDALITAEADVASAATTDLGAASSQNIRITGTTTITSFGTATAGKKRLVRFQGILTLTYNATSLILPSAATITTAANDRLLAISLGSGNWFVYFYQRADGTSLVGGSGSVAGSDTQVQFNDGGSFGGDGGLTYNKTTDTLTVTILNTGTTGTGSVQIGTAGATLSDDGDGGLIITGNGNGSDENLKFDFDNTSNQVGVSSSSGVTSINFGSIALISTGSTITSPTVNLGSTMSTDDTSTGIYRTGLNNSGGVTIWDAVYLNSSSQWVKADANGSGTYPVKGLATATVSTGGASTIITRGTIRHDAWTWTPGGAIYLSTTAGGLTQTAPSTTDDKVQVIGYALDADTMSVEISPDYGTVGSGGGATVSDTAFASALNGQTTTAPSQNVLYDWGHLFDTDDDGKVNVLDQSTGIAITDSNGVLQTPITTSAGLAGGLSDETGTGSAVFGTAPTIDAPKITHSTLGTDDTYSGITFTGLNNSGGVTQWDVVYLNGSSQWVLADANGSGTYPARGLVIATVSTGGATTVIMQGVVRNDAWTWTPGGTIYLSTTAGGLTQTAPSTTGDKVQVIGFAIDADTMRVFPSADYGTVP